MGDHSPGEAASLIAAGADQVYRVQSSYRIERTEEIHAHIVIGMVHRFHPNILLVGATHFGRGVAARTASMLHTGLTADCIQLEIDPLSGRLLQIRPAFGGNLLATIETPHHRPQMASVRLGVMKAPESDQNRTGRIIPYNADHLITPTQVEILAEEIISSCYSITDASILIAGGKGMQNRENIPLLYELADLLGGQVAASRAAVEADWLPYECQIGQTGKTVKPRLYIACGISGQTQHVVSIMDAGTVIAINNDVDAPIFGYADYGLIGDVTAVLPTLIRELKMKKKEVEIY
ncbi:MAG: electron transfer flavoprotein subunit alpha/FixB family protein [Bacteroides sp.]|nr:electron transfer flavoprotein subunit alpha/FixB family protein [Bacteroides sp.]